MPYRPGQVLVLWPDKRWVDEDTIKGWACDALVDEEGKEQEPADIDIDEAIDIVNHYGYATTARRD
jgi:hypothetical protein